jgi:hypothetical protein
MARQHGSNGSNGMQSLPPSWSCHWLPVWPGGHPSHIYLDLARRRRKSTCWGKIQKHLPLLAQPALDMERAKTMFRCIYIFVYCAHIYN